VSRGQLCGWPVLLFFLAHPCRGCGTRWLGGRQPCFFFRRLGESTAKPSGPLAFPWQCRNYGFCFGNTHGSVQTRCLSVLLRFLLRGTVHVISDPACVGIKSLPPCHHGGRPLPRLPRVVLPPFPLLRLAGVLPALGVLFFWVVALWRRNPHTARFTQ